MEVSKHLKDKKNSLDNVHMHQKQSFKNKVDNYKQNISADQR